jgi:hypothetical protein
VWCSFTRQHLRHCDGPVFQPCLCSACAGSRCRRQSQLTLDSPAICSPGTSCEALERAYLGTAGCFNVAVLVSTSYLTVQLYQTIIKQVYVMLAQLGSHVHSHVPNSRHSAYITRVVKTKVGVPSNISICTPHTLATHHNPLVSDYSHRQATHTATAKPHTQTKPSPATHLLHLHTKSDIGKATHRCCQVSQHQQQRHHVTAHASQDTITQLLLGDSCMSAEAVHECMHAH